MKSSILLLCLIFSFAAHSGERDLVLKLKSPMGCNELKRAFTSDPVFVNCEVLNKEKISFVGISYMGKKPLAAFVSELSKRKIITGIDEEKIIKRIE